VLQAKTGGHALELASTGVDMVVLDINLPDLDGFEVCRQLRAREETASTPVIHFSATFMEDSHRIHGLQAGANGYLTHPTEPPVLVATVNAFLRAHRVEQELRRSEAKFRAIFVHAVSGIALIGPDLVYRDANPEMCHILKRSCKDVIGKHLGDFLPPDRTFDADAIQRAVESGGTWRSTMPCLLPDGSRLHLEWSISRNPPTEGLLAVVTDLTDRIRAEQEREHLLLSERAARTEAERANRVKDEFLATLSHELRTPLNAIVGWTQLLKRGLKDPAEVTRGLETIERNARVQAQLISDLLDVSRITSGKLRLETQSLDPCAMVEGALEGILPAAVAKGIQVTRALDPGAGPILGDPNRLQQVVWNLVNNAVKFTPQGGKVHVSLERDGSHIQIAVVDSGRGIKAESLPFIFERFHQADATSKREQGGLGLGLAIAKHLVEMHGGTIRAISEGEDRGAPFEVRLPVSSAPAPASQRTRAEAVHAVLRADPGWSNPALLEGLRVLVVDDDEDAGELMRRLLAESGAEVSVATTVASALDRLEQTKPNVLVSDIGMPGEDGYTLIREVRSRGFGFQQLPAVALTAYARPEDRRRALLSGFQMHVPKPVDPTELVAAIAALMGRTGRRA
jgi:PAS domain S-box-containing protein